MSSKSANQFPASQPPAATPRAPRPDHGNCGGVPPGRAGLIHFDTGSCEDVITNKLGSQRLSSAVQGFGIGLSMAYPRVLRLWAPWGIKDAKVIVLSHLH